MSTSASIVTRLQAQLETTMDAKAEAVLALSTAVQLSVSTTGAAGEGPSWSRGGELGNESYDNNGRIANLTKAVTDLGNLEQTLIEQIQNLQPFNHRQRMHV